VEEVEEDLVAALVLVLDSVVGQIGAVAFFR
jgi:hypothetical protein